MGSFTVSLCILCHDRPEELRNALMSVAGQPWHEILVFDMASAPPIEAVPGIRMIRSDDNLGVTAGRNRLAEEASGDILVVLDDDAVFLDPAIAPLQRAFANDARLGVVALRALRPGGVVASREHPFRGTGRRTKESARPCAYFVGCGYAIRRVAHVATGGYDDRYFYSTEEVDLSFRLIRDGWHLLYDPELRVEHRPSSRGRGSPAQLLGWQMRNRLLLVRAHLPLVVAVPHALVWALRTGVQAARQRSLSSWWGIAWEGLTLPVDRRPLGLLTLVRAHRHGGRVLY